LAVYEFRCADCGELTSHWCAIADRPTTVVCEHCGQPGAAFIVSQSSVRRSSASKVARLDPKYDRMVDAAMKNTPEGDPDRVLRRLKPFPKDGD
jgi:putative FmdB family regulatory protein